MTTKQVILVRKDLDMPVGKIAAQVAHASMGAVLNEGDWNGQDFTLECKDAMAEWLPVGYSFAKVVLGVKNLGQLEKYELMAKEAGIPVAKTTDSGRTVFDGVPTVTCLAIGPAYIDDIDAITGKLRLL